MRLIDADAAICAIEKRMDDITCEEFAEGMSEAITEISLLPSVQPDTTTHDSIPAETGKNDGDGTSGDCISRQASLEKIRTMQTYKLFAGDDMILVDKAQVQTELMDLPSAQPEQTEMIKEIRKWINSKNRGNADYFIVDKIEEIINKYE